MGLDNPIHIAFLLILLLLVFGAKRLPEMGRSLGSGMRGFKDSLSGEVQPTQTPQQQTPAVAAATAPVTQDAAQVAEPVAAAAAAPVLVPAGTTEIPAA
jgi:sec-independent protein translocase protein TatA